MMQQRADFAVQYGPMIPDLCAICISTGNLECREISPQQRFSTMVALGRVFSSAARIRVSTS